MDANGHATAHEAFIPFAEKMRAVELPELAIRIFRRYYKQLYAGATGYIDSDTAGPATGIDSYDDLGPECAESGRAALDKTIVLKLNGGLGTSMGMSGPKSLLPVHGGLRFLDVIVRQVLQLREETQARLPLVLMNSFSTHEASLEALQIYTDLTQDLPYSFLQHKIPKIRVNDLSPVDWPQDRAKEWCPPGHGDLYTALMTTGLLAQMLAAGYEYLFVSNADNLGAVLDQRILGYCVEHHLPFLMEVADRTPADRKGGHLAQRPEGRLILREAAQCPPDQLEIFQDIQRYRYFNTNNIWIHLPSLHDVMSSHDDMLELPLIRNEKPVDPEDPNSPHTYQLETAVGSAIVHFPGARALRIPRRRFIPVKKTNDLLLLWSDLYELTDTYDVHCTRENAPLPLITLDEEHYGMVRDLRRRFPYGAPSLRHATELRLSGDIQFGKDVSVRGKVHLEHSGGEPLVIADGTELNESSTPANLA